MNLTERFVKDLPINDFFSWCFTVSKEQSENPNHELFNTAAAVLFQDSEIEIKHGIRFDTEFLPERIEIELADAILEMPVVICKLRK